MEPTFEERSDVPHVDAAGLHELTQSDLQEEDGDSPDEHDQQVRDQEDTWGGAQGGSVMTPSGTVWKLSSDKLLILKHQRQTGNWIYLWLIREFIQLLKQAERQLK